MFRKNSILLGVILGIFMPVVAYLILYFGLGLYEMLFNRELINENPSIKLISIGINLLVLRYYFVKLKYERTGKTILFMTFLYVIAFFLYY
ncbi:MAG: hypothetical protein IMY70_03350 [Bacteroidetes bacterium]|nr:hypothetical protein [Bacteroidota bacterium]